MLEYECKECKMKFTMKNMTTKAFEILREHLEKRHGVSRMASDRIISYYHKSGS